MLILFSIVHLCVTVFELRNYHEIHGSNVNLAACYCCSDAALK